MSEFHQWIEIFVGISVIALFFIKVNQDRDSVLKTIEQNATKAKEEADAKLMKAQEEGDAKRTRMYQRMDEVKKYLEDKYEFLRNSQNDVIEKVRKEMNETFVDTKICSIVHTNSDASIKEVKEQIGKIFDEIKTLNNKLGYKKE
jgi:uncharacterized protein YpuA (DUF1002 family)